MKQLYSYLFNIQEKNTADIKNPTSMWPHRKGDKMPRPISCGNYRILIEIEYRIQKSPSNMMDFFVFED